MSLEAYLPSKGSVEVRRLNVDIYAYGLEPPRLGCLQGSTRKEFSQGREGVTDAIFWMTTRAR